MIENATNRQVQAIGLTAVLRRQTWLSCGFTLIEMLAVVAILALIISTALSLLHVTSTISRQDVAIAALQAALERGRAAAQVYGEAVVHFTRKEDASYSERSDLTLVYLHLAGGWTATASRLHTQQLSPALWFDSWGRSVDIQILLEASDNDAVTLIYYGSTGQLYQPEGM